MAESRVRTHWVDIPDFENFEFCSKEQLKSATDQILKFSPKRGDLVAVKTGLPERNNGLLIFNGEEVEELATDLDEYGHLPKYCQPFGDEKISTSYWHVTNFSVLAEHERQHVMNKGVEFIPYDRVITHNNIIWYNMSRLYEKVSDKLHFGPLPWNSNIATVWAKVDSKDGEIYFVYDSDESNEKLDEIVEVVDMFPKDRACAFDYCSNVIDSRPDSSFKVLYIQEL